MERPREKKEFGIFGDKKRGHGAETGTGDIRKAGKDKSCRGLGSGEELGFYFAVPGLAVVTSPCSSPRPPGNYEDEPTACTF